MLLKFPGFLRENIETLRLPKCFFDFLGVSRFALVVFLGFLRCLLENVSLEEEHGAIVCRGFSVVAAAAVVVVVVVVAVVAFYY